MEQIINKRVCKKHPNSSIEFMQVKHVNQTSNKSLFYCSACIDEDLSFKGIDHILINKIAEQNEAQIIQKWPPIDNQQIIEQLIQTAANSQSHSTVEQSIINFFSVLKLEISNRVDICQKKMVGLIKDYTFDVESIFKQYQSISQISELKRLFCDNNQVDLYTKEESLKQFITQVEEKNEENTQKLQDLLDKSQKKHSLINFEFPNQLKDSILFFIDEINFFSMNEIDQLNSNSNNNNSHSDQILRLISNKSNFCSDEFLNEVKTKLSKVNLLFKSLSFDNQFQPNKQPIQFEDLTNEQLDKMNNYVKHMTQLNRDTSYLEAVKNSEQVSKFKQMLDNSDYQIRADQIKDLDEWLIETYHYSRYLNFVMPQVIDIMPNLQLEKGNYKNGSFNLIIDKQLDKILVQNSISNWSNCISNIILQRDKKYIFRFQFQKLDSSFKNFMIGLMKPELVHTNCGYEHQLSCCLKIDDNSNEITLFPGQNYGIYKDLKGRGFKMNSTSNEQIEMRVCIQEQVLEILDYPHYTYRIGINDNQKQNLMNSQNLKLYIGLSHKEMKATLRTSLIVTQFNH